MGQAGDLLVLRCPTWQWQSGDPKGARPFLPADKQFLLTRNVPCQRRARALGKGADDEFMVTVAGTSDGDDGDEWVATHASHTVQADDDAPTMSALGEAVESLELHKEQGKPAAANGKLFKVANASVRTALYSSLLMVCGRCSAFCWCPLQPAPRSLQHELLIARPWR